MRRSSAVLATRRPISAPATRRARKGLAIFSNALMCG